MGVAPLFFMKGGVYMSGESRGWLLPVIVVAAGLFFLIRGITGGTLNAVTLKPVNWAGIALMVAGLISAFMKKPALKLMGVTLCGIGAIMVICL